MEELPINAPDKRPHDRKLTQLENAMIDAIAAELSRLANSLVRGISAENVNEIEQRLQDASQWQQLRDALARHIQDAATFGVDIGRGYVEAEILGVKFFEWDLANTAAIEWALRMADSLTRDLQRVTTPRILRLVADWIDNSEPIGRLFERVRGDYGYSEDRARTIAVTEVTRAFAQGNQEAWRESGVVAGMRWSTSNDELTCPICRPLNGTVAPLGGTFADGIESPPAHPRCRCWISPEVN